MVWLDSSINHKGAMAAPVLLAREFVDPIDVVRGIRARERRPEEIAQRLSNKLAVVDDDNHAKPIERMIAIHVRAEPPHGPSDVLAACNAGPRRFRVIKRRP